MQHGALIRTADADIPQSHCATARSWRLYDHADTCTRRLAQRRGTDHQHCRVSSWVGRAGFHEAPLLRGQLKIRGSPVRVFRVLPGSNWLLQVEFHFAGEFPATFFEFFLCMEWRPWLPPCLSGVPGERMRGGWRSLGLRGLAPGRRLGGLQTIG